MTDHLPECRRWFTNMPAPDECPACEMFRACEQRVWKVAYNQGLGAGSDMHGQHEKGWIKGYDAGYDAALRDAVERIMSLPYEIDGEVWVDRDGVIGWIDKLREVQP